MAYDPKQDVVMWSVEEPALGLEVSLVRYGSGAPKVQLSRYKRDGATKVYQKLGRVTVPEALWLGQQLPEAVKHAPAEAATVA